MWFFCLLSPFSALLCFIFSFCRLSVGGRYTNTRTLPEELRRMREMLAIFSASFFLWIFGFLIFFFVYVYFYPPTRCCRCHNADLKHLFCIFVMCVFCSPFWVTFLFSVDVLSRNFFNPKLCCARIFKFSTFVHLSILFFTLKSYKNLREKFFKRRNIHGTNCEIVSFLFERLAISAKRYTLRGEKRKATHITTEIRENPQYIFAKNKETNLPSIQLPFYVCNSSLLLLLLPLRPVVAAWFVVVRSNIYTLAVQRTRRHGDGTLSQRSWGMRKGKNSSQNKQIFFGFLWGRKERFVHKEKLHTSQ